MQSDPAINLTSCILSAESFGAKKPLKTAAAVHATKDKTAMLIIKTHLTTRTFT
jgi:hypothetical protein